MVNVFSVVILFDMELTSFLTNIVGMLLHAFSLFIQFLIALLSAFVAFLTGLLNFL